MSGSPFKLSVASSGFSDKQASLENPFLDIAIKAFSIMLLLVLFIVFFASQTRLITLRTKKLFENSRGKPPHFSPRRPPGQAGKSQRTKKRTTHFA
jgi:hypothetical protein